ncbi:hypothetical protein SEA_DARDANUS_67 [Gordonia phage Dardanus]|uniref:Uncharacterized protein n=1 Tax=Gordonia phage Dardanus TaxID=2588489 RepID=A0A514CX60_9CAUD|nr:hypothetical protein KDJ58_gp67 [Gordonia phage Dardanus]QDH85104.1 hypothetical protein SEA_DARDANUS_67 [Gordonia phage Dardanus]
MSISGWAEQYVYARAEVSCECGLTFAAIDSTTNPADEADFRDVVDKVEHTARHDLGRHQAQVLGLLKGNG